MKLRAISSFLCFLTATGLHADVTARYSATIQMSALLPGMDEAVKAVQSGMPSSTVVRMKGGKGYSKFGKMEAITDYTKQEITLFDTATKTYAIAPVSQLTETLTGAMPDVPGDAGKMLAAMKTHFESRKTGRTETILGIQGEETEGVLTVEGPAVPGMPQNGPMMKMVMRIWVARPEETLRVQALREMSGYKQYADNVMNTGTMLKRVLGKMPGMGEGIDSMFQEIQKNQSVMLRTQMEMQMPMLAQLAQQMAKAGQPLPAGFDPNAPFMQMNQELVELSDAPLDDALFRVPDGFRQVPVEELVKSMMPARAAGAMMPAGAKQ
ncbi:MAG: hypothetical protein LAP40_10430 [Acidobacteriia bacterium]|nr:hypothetical protein [Terriglobia bacterium]